MNEPRPDDLLGKPAGAPGYSAKRVADLLGVSQRAVERIATLDNYPPRLLWELRQRFQRMPRPLGGRTQLFLNFKGGTGKTSLSTSYAYRMAERGHTVLLVDLDSQGHATKCLGLDGDRFNKTLLDVLVRKVPLTEAVQPTLLPNLHVLPSNMGMSSIDLFLMPLAGRELRLRNALREVEGRYDSTVLDAPPSSGLLNLNALVAADDSFVPVLADFLSFHGLKLLFEAIRTLGDDLGHVLEHIFIVVNAFNQTYKLAHAALEALGRYYPEYLLETVVRQCTRFAQASSEGVPVFVMDPSCKGAQDVETLIGEVLQRLEATQAATTLS